MRFEVLKMVEKDNRSMSLKFGVVLAISLGGVLYYSLYRRKMKPSKPGPPREFTDPNPADANDEHDQEIRLLGSKLKILEEKEHSLELQLLELYSIKEQETAMMDVQSQLRLHDMEAKLHDMKIKSLESYSKMFESRMDDYARVGTEIKEAKMKIKMLRKKLRSQAEQNRNQTKNLHERLKELQDTEKKSAEVELKMELDEMKKSNEELKWEKSDLAQKLEYVQMLAASAMDDDEVAELKQENEHLKEKIKQLQVDWSTDRKELVRLRWINSCLRQELLNSQPGDGKNAVNLSEQKAKPSVLGYAHKESHTDEANAVADIDHDRFLSSRASPCLTDAAGHEHYCVPPDALEASKVKHSSKRKVFSKLRRLLLKKGSSHGIKEFERPAVAEDMAGRPHGNEESERSASVEDMVGRHSCDSASSTTDKSSEYWSRQSLDLPTSSSTSMKSISRESSNSSGLTSDGELLKYAEGAKNPT